MMITRWFWALQETKALLQRDLARQYRDTDVRRLDKAEVESAWQRAKLEMETDDFLDDLADNPSGNYSSL